MAKASYGPAQIATVSFDNMQSKHDFIAVLKSEAEIKLVGLATNSECVGLCKCHACTSLSSPQETNVFVGRLIDSWSTIERTHYEWALLTIWIVSRVSISRTTRLQSNEAVITQFPSALKTIVCTGMLFSWHTTRLSRWNRGLSESKNLFDWGYYVVADVDTDTEGATGKSNVCLCRFERDFNDASMDVVNYSDIRWRS